MPWILLVVGLLLIFVEFYLPGAVLGTIGAIMLLASIVTFAQEANSVAAVLGFILLVGLSIAYLIHFTLQRIRKTSKEGTIYLESDQEGYMASEFAKGTIGKEGVAASDLKPSGHIYVEGIEYQAMAESGYITKGTRIEVIGGRGANLIVKSVKKEAKS
ncbi:MAG: NfeD family protein [Chlamydiales bacterium]|nr:NfeD family protein [Chlamydiales bacterium]